MKKLMMIVLVAVGLSACTVRNPITHAPVAHRKPTPVRPAVVTCEETGPCQDVQPPTRLDIRIRPADASDGELAAADQRCADMGGTSDWSLGPTLLMCRGVDY